MAVKSYFFDAVISGGVADRVYSSSDFVGYLAQLVGDGVFPNPSTQLQVTADGSGMSVTVKAGSAWIQGRKLTLTADETLTIDAADATKNRIDRVIAYMDTTTRACGVSVLKGTAASAPSAPALTRSATRYELSLAKIYIAAASTTVKQANITDTRPDSDECGFVAGLIQQVDTSTLFAQYQAAYSAMAADMEAYYTAQQAAFNAWMSQLTAQLHVGAFVKRYEKSATIMSGGSKTVDLTDIPGYTPGTGDIVDVHINGLLGLNGTDYTANATSVTITAETGTLPTIVTIQITKAVLGIPAEGNTIAPMEINAAINNTNTIEEVES